MSKQGTATRTYLQNGDDGQTALEMAEMHGKGEVAALLRSLMVGFSTPFLDWLIYKRDRAEVGEGKEGNE